MTPNFALSLSFEGIRLLHRVPGGWHVIGEVAPDADDLAGGLTDLRQKAMALEPGPVHTKLIIPADQIRFITIDTAQTLEEDITAALDGATPYAVDELEIDFDRTGGRTYIAAVAKETLEEAEAFAIEHKFEPVAFIAEPEPLTFRREIFFGSTDTATKNGLAEKIGRENELMAIVGSATLPEPDVVEDDAPVIAEDEPLAPFVFASAHRKPAPDTIAETEDSEALDAVAEDDASIEDNIVEDEAEAIEAADEAEPVDDDELAPDENDTPPPVFGTRREPSITPPSAAPAVGAAMATSAPPSKPIVLQPELIESDASVSTADQTQGKRSKKEAEQLTVYGARGRDKVGGKPRFLGLMLMGALVVFLFLVAIWANTLGEDGIAGWFAPPMIIEPETIAPLETDVVLTDPQPEATPEPAAEVVVETAPADVETTEVETAAFTTPTPELAPETPALPVLRQTIGRVLSPAEADRIYAATGVYQRAPRLPLLPEGGSLDGFIPAKSVISQGRLDQVLIPPSEALLPDPLFATPRNPPPAGVTFARDLRGFILATPEGTVTPDGAIVFAGAPDKIPPFRPGTEVPDVVIERPLTGGNAPLVLVAGPPPKLPPLRPAGLAPLPEALADAAGDNSSVLTSTDDLFVLAGAPLRKPPLRPDDFASRLPEPEPEVVEVPEVVIADETPTFPTEPDLPNEPDLPTDLAQTGDLAETAALELAAVVVNPTDRISSSGAALANFRPSVRPAVLAPQSGGLLDLANPTLAGYRPALRPAQPLSLLAIADPELAGFRPNVRPAGLVNVPTPADNDITSVLAAISDAAPSSPFVTPTSLAVVNSERPNTRPRNFAQIVARADRAAPQATRASAAAPAVIRGPTPGGVARAATIDNAIRLRDINLIGVYGRASNRYALVRLSNGRYLRVSPGDPLDGGSVTAIGESALNYVKRGRTYTLEIPSD